MENQKLNRSFTSYLFVFPTSNESAKNFKYYYYTVPKLEYYVNEILFSCLIFFLASSLNFLWILSSVHIFLFFFLDFESFDLHK
mmetsp:Transcript_27075/g.62270  ORF Transcript_27075/g.62270 Transcript_27075/m.62270 type:complete len:84 (-) Transcript_27075:677-928(-)